MNSFVVVKKVVNSWTGREYIDIVCQPCGELEAYKQCVLLLKSTYNLDGPCYTEYLVKEVDNEQD